MLHSVNFKFQICISFSRFQKEESRRVKSFSCNKHYVAQSTITKTPYGARMSPISYISIILLIREAKSLDPFLRKLRGRRSVKFDTVIHHKEE